MLRLLLIALLWTPLAVEAGDDAIVRVRVLEREGPSRGMLSAEGGSAQILLDGRILDTVGAGSTVGVEVAAGGVSVRSGGTAAQGTVLQLIPHAGASIRIRAGQRDRSYRGTMEVAADGRALRLINAVSLDDYITSVIPSEYPFPEIEGVKAQAVLVRTYALRSSGRFGSYDLVDHVGSQVYRGIESETPLARRAAEATRGEVLTFGGELIEAVYFSSSGGHTADNESIWDGQPRPYLRGRPDPFDGASPLHRWTETLDRDRVLRALSRAYGFQVTGLAVVGTSPEGRVTRIRLMGSRERVEQANRFRLTLNDVLGRQVLKSTFFTLERQGNRYVFTGRGFGHGVGMSQYGAREQARQGYGYTDILAFYFQGVTLERRSTFQHPPAAVAEISPEVRPIEPRPVRPVHTETTRRRSARTGW